MSTCNDLPKQPTSEIMEWIDMSWGISAEAAYQAASLKMHREFSYYACQEVA